MLEKRWNSRRHVGVYFSLTESCQHFQFKATQKMVAKMSFISHTRKKKNLTTVAKRVQKINHFITVIKLDLLLVISITWLWRQVPRIEKIVNNVLM